MAAWRIDPVIMDQFKQTHLTRTVGSVLTKIHADGQPRHGDKLAPV
jgi:hypothetical protein